MEKKLHEPIWMAIGRWFGNDGKTETNKLKFQWKINEYMKIDYNNVFMKHEQAESHTHAHTQTIAKLKVYVFPRSFLQNQGG